MKSDRAEMYDRFSIITKAKLLEETLEQSETRKLVVSDIYVVIRNQADTAMSSLEGELLVVMLTTEGIVYRQTTVSLRVAAAFFRSIPGGQYSVIVRHSALDPTEARFDVLLPEDAVLGIRFVYDEPNRQLLSVETEMRSLND